MEINRFEGMDLSDENIYLNGNRNIGNLEHIAYRIHKRCVEVFGSSRRVDARKAAHLLGVKIIKEELPDNIRGRLGDDKKTILINKALVDYNLKNQTILHELSHHIQHRYIQNSALLEKPKGINSLNELLRLEYTTNLLEVEAKYLTSLIMLPTDLLLKAFKAHGSITKIAQQFNVSVRQVMRRLNQSLYKMMGIPTHWIESFNLKVVKHEIHDTYRLPSGFKVTEKHEALFYAPYYNNCSNGVLQYFAFEEKMHKKFVTYVFCRRVGSGILCDAFGFPSEKANKFNFYPEYKRNGEGLINGWENELVWGTARRRGIFNRLSSFLSSLKSKKSFRKRFSSIHIGLSSIYIGIGSSLIGGSFLMILNHNVKPLSQEILVILSVGLLFVIRGLWELGNKNGK